MTVPVVFWPPSSDPIDNVNPLTQGESTVSVFVAELEAVARIVACAFAPTALVVMGKLPLVVPAAMVKEAGTEAAAWLLDNEINAPPDGAGAVNVTVPVAPDPPVTLPDEREKAAICTPAGFTMREAERLLPAVAVIEIVCVATGLVVVTANVALVCPAGIVTELFTAAIAGLLLTSPMVAPPVGAAAANEIVPVAPAPPVTVDGTIETAATNGLLSCRVTLTPPHGAPVNAVTADPISESRLETVRLTLPLVCPSGIVTVPRFVDPATN